MQVHRLGFFLHHVFRHEVCRPQKHSGPCRGPFHTPTPGPWPTPTRLPLTLVLDEAVSCQELQRVHFEEHAVEEEVVGGGPTAGVAGQAGQDELLRAWRGQAHVAAVSLPWPTV